MHAVGGMSVMGRVPMPSMLGVAVVESMTIVAAMGSNRHGRHNHAHRHRHNGDGCKSAQEYRQPVQHRPLGFSSLSLGPFSIASQAAEEAVELAKGIASASTHSFASPGSESESE